jgi:transposase
MKINVLAIDLAKSVFQVHGFSATGERLLAKRLSRRRFGQWLQVQDRCEVVMEACGSAHYWGRWLLELGYRVRLIPPQHVRGYVVGNKTDGNDADAIYEASQRRRLRWVPVKTVEQQDALLAHRVRERRQKARIAVLNQIRGLLAERGLVCGQGVVALRRLVESLLEAGAAGQVTEYFVQQLAELRAEWRHLEEQIKQAERAIQAHVRASPACQRLMEARGIGVLTASAAVATVGQARQFHSARQMAAWLGVTPRERSSGERRQLGGVTKRGDPYLRTLMIHGARSTVKAARGKDDAYSRWIQALVQRRGFNKAVVAVANKNARILWVLLTRGERYRAPGPIAA